MKGIDWAWESNPHVVARYAAELGDRIREEDPAAMFDHMANFAHRHPAKAAQVLMTLAAWFDPEQSVKTLTDRVEAITASRIARVVG